MPSSARSSRGRSRPRLASRLSVADLTGTGVQDTAIATLARMARSRGCGHDVRELRSKSRSGRQHNKEFHAAQSEILAGGICRAAGKDAAGDGAKGIDLLIVTIRPTWHWLTGYDGWSFYVHQACSCRRWASRSGRPRAGRERRQAHRLSHPRRHRRLCGPLRSVDRAASDGPPGRGDRRRAGRTSPSASRWTITGSRPRPSLSQMHLPNARFRTRRRW